MWFEIRLLRIRMENFKSCIMQDFSRQQRGASKILLRGETLLSGLVPAGFRTVGLIAVTAKQKRKLRCGLSEN